MVNVLTSGEVDTLREVARSLEQRGLAEESAALWRILSASRREEVSASAAARILHMTPTIIRNWVKRGILDGRTDEAGHVYVRVSSLMPAIEMDAAMPRRAASEPEISEDEILKDSHVLQTALAVYDHPEGQIAVEYARARQDALSCRWITTSKPGEMSGVGPTAAPRILTVSFGYSPEYPRSPVSSFIYHLS